MDGWEKVLEDIRDKLRKLTRHHGSWSLHLSIGKNHFQKYSLKKMWYRYVYLNIFYFNGQSPLSQIFCSIHPVFLLKKTYFLVFFWKKMNIFKMKICIMSYRRKKETKSRILLHTQTDQSTIIWNIEKKKKQNKIL